MPMNQELQKAFGLFENMPVAYAIFRVGGENGTRFSFYYANASFFLLFGLAAANLSQAEFIASGRHGIPSRQSKRVIQRGRDFGNKKTFFSL